MKLYTIIAGYFKLDGGAMHGVVPKSMWQKVNPADDNNMCSWAMRCLLIDTGDRKILIDNGMGDKQDAKFFGHYHPHGDETLASSLAKHGFTHADITDVFLTHLHFDHCGGSIVRDGDKLIPAFPNATYWSNKAHWASATNPNERERASFLKENILPIQESGQLKWVEAADGEEWLPCIRIRYVQGHTDNMMLPQIDYNGQTVFFCADLIPSAAHISMPWVMAYDMRPLDTLNEKRTILQEAVDNNWLLFFEHDPKIEVCTLVNDNGRVKMGDSISL
ncbi:MBL fold metallo-hydrolase [Chitinophagaceae bacterium IBVUCB1]|nr:MBL fold metallo-hydrolase [Chitinophagaceae bacterium IBVUCB1]